MSQKKNEQNVKGYVSESFVNTLWDQYEDAIERSRKFQEERTEVYKRTLDETLKFNSEFRHTFLSFYEESTQANTNVLNSFRWNKADEETESNQQAFLNQWQEVVGRWERLLLTPGRTSIELMERFEKRAVENTKSYLDTLQKSQKERSAASDEYIKLARTTHQKFVRRLEDSFKVLVGN
ncbi:MAG TPA: hypothetical protein VEY51_19935 [Chondromyces sp.]|nr:hypothetical protein [Chondromyces sp.]